MCGISSGTNVAAALKLAKKLGRGKTVVTVLPDTAERYFQLNYSRNNNLPETVARGIIPETGGGKLFTQILALCIVTLTEIIK